MNTEGQIQILEQKMQALISEEADIFLVEIRIKPTNNIKVFLDGDKGISIEKLTQYNRRLYRDLEENNFYSGADFSLEISSPGLDEPLKLHRQYVKNIDRFVEVLQQDGVKLEGKLISATTEEIVVAEEKGKGKKKEIVEHTIPVAAIKATRIQVKF